MGSRLGSSVLPIAFVGLFALAIRLVYVLVIAKAPVGVGGDAGFYHSAANLIAQGHFLYRGIFGHAYATTEHPPLYPLLLSVSSLLGGTSLLTHRIVGCVVGSGAVVLIGLLGRRVAGERAGVIAGLLAAVFPPLITADGLVMSEPLFVLLVAAALLCAFSLRSRPTRLGAVALGLIVGLATLTRGEGILLLPLLGWPAAWRPAPGRAQRLLVATLGTAILVVPWIARNAIVFHRFEFAGDAGTLIAGANCSDTYYGHDIGWWSLDCLASGRTRHQLDIGEASTTEALDYAGNHIGRLPLVAAVRILRTFNLFQPARQGNRELRRHWVDVVGLAMYYPVLVLAGFGLWRVGRQRWLLLAPVWMVVIVSALGWGIGRFRIGADVSLLVLAAVALAGGLRGVGRAQPARSRPAESPASPSDGTLTRPASEVTRPITAAPG